MLRDMLMKLKQKNTDACGSVQPKPEMTEIGKEYLENIGGATSGNATHDMFSRNYPDPNPYWKSITRFLDN